MATGSHFSPTTSQNDGDETAVPTCFTKGSRALPALISPCARASEVNAVDALSRLATGTRLRIASH